MDAVLIWLCFDELKCCEWFDVDVGVGNVDNKCTDELFGASRRRRRCDDISRIYLFFAHYNGPAAKAIIECWNSKTNALIQ